MPDRPFVLSPHEIYADTLHHYLRELPPAVDTKIEIFFAIVLGVLLFHVRVAARLGEEAAPTGLSLQNASFLDYCAVILLLASMICALLVVWPRLSADAKGYSSFVAVASRPDGATYAQEVLALDGDALATALFAHCYELARITRRKIVWCRLGMAIGLTGIALAVVAQLLG